MFRYIFKNYQLNVKTLSPYRKKVRKNEKFIQMICFTTFLYSGELCRANMSPFVNLSIGARSDLLDQLEHSRWIFQGGEVHIVEPGHSENKKFEIRLILIFGKNIFWGWWKWHLYPIYETQKKSSRDFWKSLKFLTRKINYF